MRAYPSVAAETSSCPRCEEPSARLEAVGASALAESELLALIIGGVRGLEAARGLLAEAGTVAELHRLVSSGAMARIGAAAARRITAALELARRVPQATASRPVLDRPEKAVEYFRPFVSGLDVEKFWVLCLNRRNRLLKRVEMTSGTANATLAHPREVFRIAVREGASAVLCAHNHPSGDPSPSQPDVNVTRQLRDAARLIDIALVDHVIIGTPAEDPLGKGYYSFREAGTI